MTTLKDVALRANVSKMTVSRVINHPHLVTEELKTLVYQAMEELDYRPNTIAKALARQRTLVVKVLILEEMDVTEPYYMHLLAGIAKELDKHQYALQLMTENTVDVGDCDGYIITGMRMSDYEWISKVEKPVVLFGENQEGVPFVDSHNEKATHFATHYAQQRGYEHIEFVGIDVPEYFEVARENGYRTAMEMMGEKPTIHRIKNSSMVASQLIQSLDLKVNTCFVCASDRIAFGINRQLRLLGLDVPHDFGIIGFDGVFLDRISSPKLTTMKQNIMDMGRTCVKQLMKLIDGEELQDTHFFYEAEMIKRETTK